MFSKMEIDVIKYIGGPNHITILYRNPDTKKLFIFYCYTSKPIINIENEIYNTSKKPIINCKTAEITIPINTYKDGVWHQVEIAKEEDFELAEKIISSIMED